MKSTHTARGLLNRAPLAAAVAFALLSAPAAQAFEFEKGGLTGSLDTTISYFVSVRTEDADPDLIGKAYFDPALCRNISVDIRYTLFVIEKFGGAGWLLKELKLVK